MPDRTRSRKVTDELAFKEEAASEYDRALSHASANFVPFLLRAARLKPGHTVLDVASGTGIAAAAALDIVGSRGSVTAVDISSQMVERARRRLAGFSNASAMVEDGQALTLPDAGFDAVLCNLGLMFFPDPLRGLSEFRRVLRPGGCAAVSVLIAPERSYNGRINVVVARYVPGLAEATARTFALGDPARLQALFGDAGFTDIETFTEKHTFVLPSFDAYYGPFERGGASTGQVLVGLPKELRRAIREEVRRDLGDTGDPIEIEMELRFASGRR
jgi:ubiquinone/menaquinone biosynthesis C-methylase UbiE